MDNTSIREIQNKLLELPYLEKKLNALLTTITDETKKVDESMENYKLEAEDVENLQKETLSVSVLKFFGKYEDKITKETEEMLSAKLQYDKLKERARQLNIEREELQSRIISLKQDKALYEAELSNREMKVKSNINSQIFLKYKQYESEQQELSYQVIEVDEAVRAANKVINSANEAINHLKSAEDWATFDVWTRGGIFSHIAKYDHIDSAQLAFNRLASQIKDLDKELSDINLTTELEFLGIDSTTRTIDFWLDNIFTDLNVRERINDDTEKMYSLKNKLNDLNTKLQKNKNDNISRIDNQERQKEALLISGVTGD